VVTPRRWAGDRGSASIELVILGPAFMLLLGLLVMGGRLAIANQTMQSAASAAARSVTIERGGDSEERGREAAARVLDEQGTQCTQLDVALDLTGKDTDPGVVGQSVTATVTCKVDLSGLGLPGIDGARTVEASAKSPVDTYRER
jgi:Flp pilus assembly protein TadG